MKSFIFDVDGTLTPSRGRINKDFQLWFTNFCIENDVYLVTGSDRSKTIEQLGNYLCCQPVYIYNCSGSDVWAKDKNIRTNAWTLPTDAHEWLSKQLTASDFKIRTGLHFEYRPGMVNFSIVGRNADVQQRQAWIDYEVQNNDRQKIANKFNTLFPNLQATVGGETGIDIAVKGADKSQILTDFGKDNFILFFGDRMNEGGNDYPLAKAILDKNLGKCYHVRDWKHTWEILRTL